MISFRVSGKRPIRDVTEVFAAGVAMLVVKARKRGRTKAYNLEQKRCFQDSQAWEAHASTTGRGSEAEPGEAGQRCHPRLSEDTLNVAVRFCLIRRTMGNDTVR